MSMFFFVISAFLMFGCALAGASVENQRVQPQRAVVFLGPPGSGKGTQAIELAKKLDVPHISTGDLFRDNIKRGTALGIKAKKYIDAGQLSPDQLVTDMLLERIGRDDAKRGYLLDGYPRNLPQAKTLEVYLTKSGAHVSVIYLNVSDDVVTKRLGGRLVCRKEGHVFNIHFSPPKQEGKCDLCASELYQRSDDSPEVIAERLAVYHELTKPLIDFYQKKRVLHTIDGEQPPSTVRESIEALFRSTSTQ